jgi:hypothetical protein
MAAQSYQLDDVSILVIPYQQEVAIDVAFQAAFVFPAKRMREINSGDGKLQLKHLEYFFQVSQLLRIIPIPFQVFFILGCRA